MSNKYSRGNLLMTRQDDNCFGHTGHHQVLNTRMLNDYLQINLRYRAGSRGLHKIGTVVTNRESRLKQNKICVVWCLIF
jgi:hypothetical protein